MKSKPELVILVPVKRPHRVKPLVRSIADSTPNGWVHFVADHADQDVQDAVRHAFRFEFPRVSLQKSSGNYAAKITAALTLIRINGCPPYVFTGADDLHFHAGWFDAAKAYFGNGIEVVGVNDLIPRKRDHQTHFLMTRRYAEQPTIDGQPGPFHHEYHHWSCDDELIATAKHRGAYAYAPDAIVQHLHPMAGNAEDDDTYREGRRDWKGDRKRFLRREHLWA